MKFATSFLLGLSLAAGIVLNAHADLNAGIAAANSGDFKTSVKEWEPLAKAGNAEAQYNLGALLLSDKIGQTNVKSGMQWLEKAAASGHLAASYALGMIFYTGYEKEVPQDRKRAYKLFEQGAQRGYAPSQFGIGMMLMNGEGVKQDPKAAAAWLTKAADQGHAMAQYNLAMYYAHGQDGKKDPALVFQWYLKAANQGLPAAQFNVGQIYLNGNGAPMDATMAKSWFAKAADKGSVEAKYQLGLMSYFGMGGAKNSSEAQKWFEQAAKGWDRNAQFHLGKMYMDGDGVKQDLVEAYKWLDLAASNGHEDAHFLRALAGSKISSAEKERAHKLAQEWFDSNHKTPHRHYDMKPHHH